MEISSIFEVTDFRTRENFKEVIEGCGQDAINFLRKEYPRFSKFVLKGFEVNGRVIPANLRTYSNNK